MVKPLIGINPYYFHYDDSYWNATREKYYQAVWKGGSLPVTVHYPSNGGTVAEIADRIDGLVIVGGPDLPNHLYQGGNPELLDEDVMLPERVAFDRAIFSAMKDLDKPILAICAGIQQINVFYGGTLYEDIPTQLADHIDHGVFKGNLVRHVVRLAEDSLIRRVIGNPQPEVVSTHHQGIRKLGSGLRAVGWAPDGLIEAIEDAERPEAFIAVQWHPELMLDSEEQVRLFTWLTETAERKKNG
jgi:putative glutamine amidotransferase